MKKNVFRIVFLIIFMFIISPLCVNASFNELRYEITDVYIRNSKITFKGWAFIHKTNNYVDVISDGQVVKTGGDQKILMRAVDRNGNVIETKVVSGSDGINYNFYCELFLTTSSNECEKKRYVDALFNSCDHRDDNSYCYYEDMYFSIEFDISEWSTFNVDDITFEIAVSNSDYEAKIGMPDNVNSIAYDGDIYNKPIPVSVYYASVDNYSTDYIKIQQDTLTNQVDFIASYGILYDSKNETRRFKYGDICAYGEFRNGYNDLYNLVSISGYKNGRSSKQSTCGGSSGFLGEKCNGSYRYAIEVDDTAGEVDSRITAGFSCKSIATPCTDGSCRIAIVEGSKIKISGNTAFSININRKNECMVTNPHENQGELICNKSKTLNSTCEELTVDTSVGRATVKIEQTGTISSILTPDSIYAGGGFNFGVMYYNTIKWSYVGSQPNSDLHTAVVSEMNKKLKGYENYIAGLNITQLKLGDKTYNTYDSSFLNKTCTTSDSSGNYYNKELTVSCVFSFPESILYPDGKVDYVTGGGFNINNKYYTNINYNSDYGTYKLQASIEGMDRITESAAKSDSKDNGKAWTGNWSDTFTNCEIDLYPLLMRNSKNNFIYRPIDITNPFPGRNAGINWFDWYSVSRNVDRLENSYSDLEYSVVLDNQLITEIKNYNKSQNESGGYLNWDGINVNTGQSSFVDEFVTRVGDSQ